MSAPLTRRGKVVSAIVAAILAALLGWFGISDDSATEVGQAVGAAVASAVEGPQKPDAGVLDAGPKDGGK